MVKRTRLLRIICFALIFLLLFSGISTLLMAKNYQWKNFHGFYSEKHDSLDVLYLGGSACYMSWSPYEAWQKNAYTSYALGVSSMVSFCYEPLVSEALTYQAPQLLIIDARPFIYTYQDLSSGVTSAITFNNSLLPLSVNRLPAAVKSYALYKQTVADGTWSGSDETFMSLLLDISRFHSMWQKLDENYFPPSADSLPYNYSKGLYGVPDANPVALSDNSTVAAVKETNADAMSDLLSLLDYLDRKGIDALFVVAPSAETAEQKAEYNFLASIVEARGYGFLDANDHIGDMALNGDTDFWNDNHLNIFGAEKYTAFLSDYISRNYTLKNDHSAAVNADWSAGCDAWLRISAAIKAHELSVYDDTMVND